MSLENISTLCAGVCTLGIFSFLWRENRIFRLFEHLFIGISTAIGISLTIEMLLWPKVFKPLLGFDRTPLPWGGFVEAYDSNLLLYLLPIAFGSLYYFILSPKTAWLAQLVIGFSLGVSGGMAFKGTFNELLPQLYDSFRPIWVPGELLASLSNLVFLLTLICSMSYFFLTFKRKPGGVTARASALGRFLMMGCFGAFFGSTIMARMALLVERLEFLIGDWSSVLSNLIL